MKYLAGLGIELFGFSRKVGCCVPYARHGDGAFLGLGGRLAAESNNNATNMPLRMLRYYTDIRFAGHSGPTRQFLIYIGVDPLTMPTGLEEPGLLDYRYGLIDMHQVDCAGLLAQDNPDALVLAVLCDFGDRKPQEVITYIVRRSRELLGADERGFREHMTMLQILSKNRDLEAQIKKAEHMLTEVDIESMPFFSIGFERGEKKGLEEGLAKGVEKGWEKGMERGMAET